MSLVDDDVRNGPDDPSGPLPPDVVALLAGDDPEVLAGPAIDPDLTPTGGAPLALGLDSAAGAPTVSPTSSPGEETAPPAPAGPPVDPRISARRRDVTVAKNRKRLRLLAVLGSVLLAVALTYGVTRSPLVAIDSIEVTGAERTDAEELEQVLGPIRGRSLVWLDVDGLQRRLTSLPWVKRASVSRSWPSGLLIDLGERRPVAVYGAEDGQWRVVDGDGRVVVESAGRPSGFPQIIGEQAAVERGHLAPDGVVVGASVAALLPAELLASLKAIRIDPVSGVVLELSPKGFVTIGTADDLRGKLLRMLTVLERCPTGSFDVLDVQVSPVTLSPITACPTLPRPAP
ncbi:MAG: cell division protein FtsQ/DivIB [Acidimicrobiales bacterium]